MSLLSLNKRLEDAKDVNEALSFVNEAVTNVDDIFDLTDWVNGNYQDDDTATALVAYNVEGEEQTCVYTFKKINELKKGLEGLKSVVVNGNSLYNYALSNGLKELVQTGIKFGYEKQLFVLGDAKLLVVIIGA